jgi:hypothetical protein
MTRRLVYFCVAISVIFLGLVANNGPAFAQATRTWISGVGDDANPCSRTAPCKTFAGAISKTAASGEIDCLDPGGFGEITITKSITLDCAAGQVGSILVAGTNGINIQAAATDVIRIRNLSIQGLGTGANPVTPGLNGIQITSALAVHLENVQVFGFSEVGVNFVPSGTSSLKVVASTISENSGGGILVAPQSGITATANLFQVVSNRNKFGLKVTDGGQATVKDSVASNNTSNGFAVITAGTAACQLSIQNSTASNNGAYGVLASGGSQAGALIASVGTYGNVNGLGTLNGATLASFGNNYNSGNSTNGAPTMSITPQ